MSANPSRWPRDTAPRDPAATTQFLPTMPLELAPLPAPGRAERQSAASVSEIWHDTQQQLDSDADVDEEDTQPSAFDALPPQRAAPAATLAVARPASPPAPAAAPAPLDPADPLAGMFDEAVSGLQVRELDNDDLFQRLFGAPG